MLKQRQDFRWGWSTHKIFLLLQLVITNLTFEVRFRSWTPAVNVLIYSWFTFGIIHSFDASRNWFVYVVTWILSHSSIKTGYSLFSNDEERKSLLTCCYNKHHNYWITMWSDDCAALINVFNFILCSSYQFPITLAMWMDALTSWKISLPTGNSMF